MPSARNELKTLSDENAERVARHMAMAARAIDDDPHLAHEHAQAAMRHAGRVAVVRETLAITAYATGDFALALRELRTVRRISGRNDHIAMIVDSERGVGRPEKALEEGRSADRHALPVAQRAELAIAMSGARLDLGQTELALHDLDIPEVDPNRAFEWSAGLFAARAAVLEDLGRTDEAAEWSRRARIAGDAIAAKLAEDDTVEIHEIAFDAVDEGAGSEEDGDAEEDKAVAAGDGDAALAASGATDADVTDAAEAPAEDDATHAAEASAEDEAIAVAGAPDTEEPPAPTDGIADNASYDPAANEPSIEDEVAELLEAAGIDADAAPSSDPDPASDADSVADAAPATDAARASEEDPAGDSDTDDQARDSDEEDDRPDGALF